MSESQLKLELEIVPIQGLIEKTIARGADAEVVKSETKDQLIQRLISYGTTDQEIRELIDQYAYGKVVTFTLWYSNSNPYPDELSILLALQGIKIPMDSSKFRKIEIYTVRDLADRVEIIFKYSKSHKFLSEDEKHDVIWERFIGCVWVGKNKPFLAVLSKDEKVWTRVADFISKKLTRDFNIIRPPSKVINNFLRESVRCRATLISENGEKTTLARTEGLSQNQQEELETLETQRMSISGSFKTKINQTIGVNVRNNSAKGTITIQKLLPSKDLMSWTASIIDVILEALENLSSKRAEEVFDTLGEKIEWTYPSELNSELNWLLSNLLSNSLNEHFEITIPNSFFPLLNNQDLFIASYRPICSHCDSPVGGECIECGDVLSVANVKSGRCPNGHVLFDESGSHIVCQDGDFLPRWSTEHGWFIPTEQLKKAIDRNIQKIKRGSNVVNRWYIANHKLFIKAEQYLAQEILFSEFNLCDPNLDLPTDSLKRLVVDLREKCSDSSNEACLSCKNQIPDVCFVRLIQPIIPGFKIQPHKGGEYGDISGQLKLNGKPIEFKGIIKSNSFANARKKTIEYRMSNVLLSTSNAGQGIIRQLVEQGMCDQRCNTIAIVVPQYIDADFRVSLRFLCGLVNKNISFWLLDELASIASYFQRQSNKTD